MSVRVPTVDPRADAPDQESSFKSSPLRHLRFLYLAFVQGLFAQQPKGSFHWELDPQSTEILISAESPVNVEMLNMRPAVSFTRAPIGLNHLGFDDMASFDQATGRKTKSLLVPGTMAINCLSRNDLESEHIAWVVMEHLWLLRDMLQQAGFYDVGRNMQMGSPSKAGDLVANDSGTEYYATVVTSPFMMQRTSEFTPLNQRIVNDIILRLRAGIGKPIGGAGPDMPQGMVGTPYEVDASAPPSPFPGGGRGNLPLAPHPLNPAQLVTVRTVRAGAPGLRPPTNGSAALPIQQESVEESGASVVLKTDVKV